MLNKKCIGIFIVIFIFCLFFTRKPCYAEENYKVFNTVDNYAVEPNKSWNIIFNREINTDLAEKFISVYREDSNEKVELQFNSGKNSESLNVSPKIPYESGKNYILVIDSGLTSTDGKKVKEMVKYNFKIKNSMIESYEDYYNVVKESISNYEPSVTVTIKNYNKDIYNANIIDKVVNENLRLRGICNSANILVQNTVPAKITINFKYIDTKENLQVKEKLVQNKVKEIISKIIKPGMKDYEKEIALHDYLVNNSTYDNRLSTGDMPLNSYTAYGILINGVGVCQGYAEAMDRLLKAAGIESTVIIGEAKSDGKWIGHAWNLVKINGEYYHVDTTWDNRVMDDGSSKLTHFYFNITDDEISKDHRWNKKDYVACTSKTYNFYNLDIVEKDDYENTITSIKNYDEFLNSIENAIAEEKPNISLKILKYDSNIYNVMAVVNKAYGLLLKSGSYNWTYYSDNINNSEYITIIFK